CVLCRHERLASRAFPTRRSSDLHGVARSRSLHGAVAKWLGNGLQNHHTWVRIPSAPPGKALSANGSAGCERRRGSARPAGTRCTDRKSTRLNSSHVKISYAVICL